MNILNNDTICAPATAAGGAIAIIRISGPNALPIVSTLCSLCCDAVAANTTHFTRLVEYDAVSQHPNTPIYDLQGRCISDLAPQGKGIIIQNGRKVICNKH